MRKRLSASLADNLPFSPYFHIFIDKKQQTLPSAEPTAEKSSGSAKAVKGRAALSVPRNRRIKTPALPLPAPPAPHTRPKSPRNRYRTPARPPRPVCGPRASSKALSRPLKAAWLRESPTPWWESCRPFRCPPRSLKGRKPEFVRNLFRENFRLGSGDCRNVPRRL